MYDETQELTRWERSLDFSRITVIFSINTLCQLRYSFNYFWERSSAFMCMYYTIYFKTLRYPKISFTCV